MPEYLDTFMEHTDGHVNNNEQLRLRLNQRRWRRVCVMCRPGSACALRAAGPGRHIPPRGKFCFRNLYSTAIAHECEVSARIGPRGASCILLHVCRLCKDAHPIRACPRRLQIIPAGNRYLRLDPPLQKLVNHSTDWIYFHPRQYV